MFINKKKEEDLINCFARTYIDIGNYYMEQGAIKESIKNYEKAYDYLQKEIMIRGSAQKRQKLMKMSSRLKRCAQKNLLKNILMMVNLLYNLSIAEELQENYTRVLEILNLAEWLSQIYLQDSYGEVEDLIFKAAESARNKYKELVIEEGEIHIIMDEALGIREQKQKENKNDKIEDNDFYSYYSKIFYEKYNIKELNDSQYITVTKPDQLTQNIGKSFSYDIPTNQSMFFNTHQGLQTEQHVKASTFQTTGLHNKNVHSRTKKLLTMPSNSYTTNNQGSTANTSQLNTRQSFLEETPSKFKIDSQSSDSKIKEFNLKNQRNSIYSVLNYTDTPNSNKLNSSMISLNNNNRTQSQPKKNLNNNTSANTTHTSSFQQYQFIPFESQPQFQSEDQLTKSDIIRTLEQTPVKREKFHQSGRSMSSIGVFQHNPVIKNSSFKQEPNKKQHAAAAPLPYQPKIITTNKYFIDNGMSFYSSPANQDIFLDKEKIEEIKKQQFINKMLHKPQIVQNLDIYFKHKINDEFNRKNNADQHTMEYDIIQKGIGRVMKDEFFDKDEFSNAFKLLKLKKQKNLLRQGEEVFDKKEPHELKIKTSKQIESEIYNIQQNQIIKIQYQEANQNLKEIVANKKAAQKELENQRRAKNLISDDLIESADENQKNSVKKYLAGKNNQMMSHKNFKEPTKPGVIDQKPTQTQLLKAKLVQLQYERDKQTGLNPQQIAKKGINQEIEQMDSQMRNKEKEINQLLTPQDRRSNSEQKVRGSISENPDQNQNDSDENLSPLLKKKYNRGSSQQNNRSISKNRSLKFLDQYQDISKSTQLIAVKREQKKATNFVDLAFATYKLNQGVDRNSISGGDSTRRLAQKQPSPASKIQQTLSKSLRKLMKLKTSDLQEGSTPISRHKFKNENNELVFSKQV